MNAMKKYLFVFSFFMLVGTSLKAQLYSDLNFSLKDSLNLVATTNSNSQKIYILLNIGSRYMYSNGDTAIKYFIAAERIAIDTKENILLLRVYSNISETYSGTIGNYPLGLHYAIEELKLGIKINVVDILPVDKLKNESVNTDDI